jgi:hypothetical protein
VGPVNADTIAKARDFLAGREPPPFYWELCEALVGAVDDMNDTEKLYAELVALVRVEIEADRPFAKPSETHEAATFFVRDYFKRKIVGAYRGRNS